MDKILDYLELSWSSEQTIQT